MFTRCSGPLLIFALSGALTLQLACGQHHHHAPSSNCKEHKHPKYVHGCAECVAHTQKSCTKCVAAGFDCHCTCGWPGDLDESNVDLLDESNVDMLELALNDAIEKSKAGIESTGFKDDIHHAQHAPRPGSIGETVRMHAHTHNTATGNLAGQSSVAGNSE